MGCQLANEQGSPQGFRYGNLKRQLDTVQLVQLDSATTNPGDGEDLSFRLRLVGLTGSLRVQIACGPISATPEVPATPDVFPATGGTIQLTPQTQFGDGAPMWLRPAFQDPFGTPHVNTPLPEALPFSYEFSTEADAVIIDVVVAQSAFVNAAIGGLPNGHISVQITVEYNGNWWDIPTIERVLGAVRITGASTNIAVVGTTGGG